MESMMNVKRRKTINIKSANGGVIVEVEIRSDHITAGQQNIFTDLNGLLRFINEQLTDQFPEDPKK